MHLRMDLSVDLAQKCDGNFSGPQDGPSHCKSLNFGVGSDCWNQLPTAQNLGICSVHGPVRAVRRDLYKLHAEWLGELDLAVDVYITDNASLDSDHYHRNVQPLPAAMQSKLIQVFGKLQNGHVPPGEMFPDRYTRKMEYCLRSASDCERFLTGDSWWGSKRGASAEGGAERQHTVRKILRQEHQKADWPGIFYGFLIH
ncbi:hypothetical protein B0H13DRAFT_1869052 [Mycena leptocephala]|nr:hypothetical protein B0H13DRAFT_1869052 [Mycena leptocephala]